MEGIFAYILLQASWEKFTLALTVGVIVYALPYIFPKLGNSKAYRLLNFIALICVLVGAINLGYWGSDHDWAREQVRQERQIEMDKLQELQNRR